MTEKIVSFAERFIKLKTEMKAPKNKRNDFGRYNYRSLDDITQSLKPLEQEHKIFVTMSDELVLVGDRFYVKATARAKDGLSDEYVESYGYARESEDKKGMDQSQITGSSSTYARKYAISGLLGLDDGIDADTMDNSDTGESKKTKQPKLSEKNYATINGYESSWVKKALNNLKLDNVEGLNDEQAEQVIIMLRKFKEAYEQKQQQKSVNIDEL